ncbi:MAG TPA: protein kinase, partial [Myxococcales bacterium]|nr:protein kinase [Myxococcales bacterium]
MERDDNLPLAGAPDEVPQEAAGAVSARYSSWLIDVIQDISPLETPVPPCPRAGDRIANGRFELLSEVGAGAMGLVFRALDDKLNRVVAIKLLLPGRETLRSRNEERMKQEAQAIARLNHDNIVQVFDFDIWNGLPFLVMELLEGRTLGALVRERRPPDDLALEITCQVARGLAHAHERGLIHRDVKPSNVFITSDRRVKLLDFGLAHVHETGAPEDAGATQEVPSGGTPLYMAPEQWRLQEQDDRVDVWAVGVILFELLAGRHPFHGPTLAAIRRLVLSPEPSPALPRPDLPPAAAALLQRAMSKDRSRRTGTARELLAQLTSLQAELAGGRRHLPGKAAEPERRQVTILHCRLHGSTPPPGAPDPEGDVEEAHAAQQLLREICVGVLRRFEARVVTYAGDHLVGCLGYPVAHEDDAQRGARAALEIAGEARSRGLGLQIGIHTGVVIAEQHAGSEPDIPLAVQGDAPVIARRLAQLAPPGAVIAGETTRQLLRGVFVTERAGDEGGEAPWPVPAFRVLRERPLGSRFEAELARERTRFVGREQEVRRLQELWAEAKAGRGQVLLLSGEAGIGKSRLAQVLKDLASAEGHPHLTSQGWQHLSSSAFLPVIELLQQTMGISRQEPPAEKLARIESTLGGLQMSLPEHVPLLAALLSIPFDPGYGVPLPTGVLRIERTIQTLVEMLRRMAARRPLLYLFEDIHWMDPSTLELVAKLVGQVPDMRALVVLTFRPEAAVPWRAGGHVSWIKLDGLPVDQAARMISNLAGGPFPAKLAERLLLLGDGIPLFIEELTRMALQLLTQDPDRALAAIPPKLNELLLARLEILGPAEKELAQMAAAAGRRVSHAVLARCAGVEEEALRSSLDGLVHHGFLEREGQPPAAAYRFRHALIQGAIYQSLLKRKRQQHHAEIARVLQELHPDVAEIQPELLAHHYTEAQQRPQAIELWGRAGQRAAQRFAHVEAIDSFGRALELLSQLPPSPERTQREVDLLLGKAASLVVTRGYAAPEVAQTYERARALCSELKMPPQMFPAVMGLWLYFMSACAMPASRQLGEQLVGMAEGDPALLVPAYRALGTSLLMQGEITAALETYERAMALDDLHLRRGLVLMNGQDSGIYVRSWAAWACVLLGDPDRALALAQEAVDVAEALKHPLTIGVTRSYLLFVLAMREEPERALEEADRSMAFCAEHRLATWVSWAQVHAGHAAIQLGRWEEGFRQLQGGVEGWQRLGARAGLTYLLPLVGEAFLARGAAEDCLRSLDEAQRVLEQGDEHYFESRMHCLRARALLALDPGDRDRARAWFERALEVALRQRTLPFALSAALEW